MLKSWRWQDYAQDGLFLCGLTLSAAFLAGAPVMRTARVLSVLAAAVALAAALSHPPDAAPARRSAARVRLLMGLLVAVWTLVVLRPLTGIVLGTNGIDFAIFSQAIFSIAHEGVPWVSLITPHGRVNFLTHHLVPYLYLPGALAAMGVHPAIAGIAVHAVGLAMCFVALWVAFRWLGLNPVLAGILTCAAALSPSLRLGYAWTMNDEMYGAPFVVLGVCLWLRGSYRSSALAFAVSCACKESFSAVALVFAVMAYVSHAEFRPETEWAEARKSYLALGLLSGLILLGYFFLQPLLWHKGFDHANKLASVHELLDAHSLQGKLKFLLWILLPTLGLPLLSLRGRRLLWLAAPGVVFSLVSRFEPMWAPNNYYCVTPVLVSFLAAAASWPVLERRFSGRTLAAGVVVLWMEGLSSSPQGLRRSVTEGLRQPWLRSALLSWAPKDAVIAADPAAALFLLDRPNLRRLWSISREVPPSPVDVVVWKPSGYEEPPELFLSGFHPCHPDSLWNIECP